MSFDPERHFVAPGVYDPEAERQVIERKDLDAATRVLVWRRFLKNRLAVISGAFLLVIYLALPFVDFLAPYGPNQRNDDYLSAPPQAVGLFDGGLLVAYPIKAERDMQTFQWVYVTDREAPAPVRWFA
ncbi:MAG: hypothetical protein R6W78_11455, partial [Bacteroidales bacterium]